MRFSIQCIACIALLAACGGQEYADAAAVLRVQKEQGFVRLGSFGGTSGSVTITEERTHDDSIEFAMASGARHSYPGYTGYTLKLLRLNDAQQKEQVLVFRSADKR